MSVEWCGVEHPHEPHQWVPGVYGALETYRHCPGSLGSDRWRVRAEVAEQRIQAALALADATDAHPGKGRVIFTDELRAALAAPVGQSQTTEGVQAAVKTDSRPSEGQSATERLPSPPAAAGVAVPLDPQAEPDALQQLIERVEAARPDVRDTREDMRHLHAVLDDLVEIRESSGVTQTQVAQRMDVKQPTVSEFETEASDPRVSTLQRYARALGLRIVITAEPATHPGAAVVPSPPEQAATCECYPDPWDHEPHCPFGVVPSLQPKEADK